ncbi:hypothetical protein KM043_010034 [Ampulex compressa]|nr:hypothetical protein KM043_010034 [Ampulex compressa]
MPTTPLKIDLLEEGARPRDWQPRRSHYKVPLRLLRLCLLGMFLPSALVAGPMYLRYRVYSEQLYPLAISDQRLIDAKVSTVWCQSQVVKVNTTFNAYLMSDVPKVKAEVLPVSMTRHLVLEDDMKEYWGFYLLRGSSVTVSTCVRWPGASLTIIRGHKHLHECAFIGDDSSEELEELLEVAKENGLLVVNGTEDMGRSNEPEKMKRARQGVQFHHKDSAFQLNVSKHAMSHHHGSHELDAKAMRSILTELFAKTIGTKQKQKENPHHHYEGVFVETANIDKPPTFTTQYPDINASEQTSEQRFKGKENLEETMEKSPSLATAAPSKAQNDVTKLDAKNSREANKETIRSRLDHSSGKQNQVTRDYRASASKNDRYGFISKGMPGFSSISPQEATPSYKTSIRPSKERHPAIVESRTEKGIIMEAQKSLEEGEVSSAEVFEDVLKKISSLGHRGKQILRRLMKEIEDTGAEGEALRRMVNETMNDGRLSKAEKQRRRRDLVLSSPLHEELTEEDDEADAGIEEGMLNPDGIAEDRGTVNETTLNDRSNSEFWSSFSSSEERLLECKGLILNLPLTPHRHCTPKHEKKHSVASFANTITYRVPINGYYFFVFNSENEVEANYVRVQFDLLKTVYNISNPVHACKNSTSECSLPFKMFSNERTVLELPLSGNDSQWNEEYVVVSTCEPRTMVYMICIIMVPLLILVFAFHS